MDILSKVQSLPDDIQSKIFFYLSSPESRLIKSLDWENEFKIQKDKAITRNIVLIEKYQIFRHLYINVFGYECPIIGGIYLHNTDEKSWNYYCDDMKEYFEYDFPINNFLTIR